MRAAGVLDGRLSEFGLDWWFTSVSSGDDDVEVHSDEDDDRTLIELTPNTETVNLDEDEDNEEIKDKSKQQFIGLNEKSFEELRSMGVPLAVLKAIAFQQTQPHNNNNNQLSNFFNK